MTLVDALTMVLRELDSAQAKHGPRFASDHELYGVLVDELAEWRDAMRLARVSGHGEGYAAQMRELADRELAQIAAVCLKGLMRAEAHCTPVCGLGRTQVTDEAGAQSAAYWRERYEQTLARTKQVMAERDELRDAYLRGKGRCDFCSCTSCSAAHEARHG